MHVLIWDLDDTLYHVNTNVDRTYATVQDIRLYPDALSALGLSGAIHILVSFARDGADVQNKKIDALGIRDFFEEIYFVQDIEDRQKIFSDIAAQYGSGNCIVVGDRIDSEIRAGNMLGMTTVLCLRGRYSYLTPEGKEQYPDYVIKDLTELADIVKE